MKKLTITVEYNENMKMTETQMVKNIQFILKRHFEDMPSYREINPPEVSQVEIEE